MIEIKIDKNNQCELHEEGSTEEILKNIRVLDTVREQILNDIKNKLLEFGKSIMPNIPIEKHKELIEEIIKETLENLIVLSEVKNQNDL